MYETEETSPYFVRAYVLKPEYEEILERQRLLLKLADKGLIVRAQYYSGPFYHGGRYVSERPFRLVTKVNGRVLKQSCFKTPEALAEAVQRIISND